MAEARPLYLRLPYLGLALIGGSLGTATREAISLAVPNIAGVPVAILAINILGAFCLGVLLSGLSRMGPDEGIRQKVRILVGTGFMGGFTTYSALATDAAGLLGEGRVSVGLLYGLATVIIGGLATWAGIALASSRRLADEAAGPATSSPATDEPSPSSPAADRRSPLSHPASPDENGDIR